MTNGEIRAMLHRVNARELRLAAGISPRTVQRALGVTRFSLSSWETGRCVPACEAGYRWIRFISGLERHAAVTEEMAATERRVA